MKRHLGQSGFSILEIVVATVVLAIIVGSSMTFMSNTETKDAFRGKIQATNACLAEANKILANIKEKGQARYRLNFPAASIKASSYLFSAGEEDQNDRDSSEPGIPHSDRWPITQPIYSIATDANVLRPNLLVMGYMTALQSMYNANGAFCTPGITSTTGYSDGTILTAPTTALLDNAVSRLRIQVFNIQTGVIGCAPASVNIRPVGASESTLTSRRRRPPGLTALNHPLSANEEVFDPAAGTRFDLGFLVTVSVEYQDRKGSNRSCSVQEKFQYNAQPENTLTLEFEDDEDPNDLGLPRNDENVPEGINSTVRSSTIANPPSYSGNNLAASGGIYNGCSGTNSRDITFRMTRTRPGSIHMCRNLSVQRSASSGGAVNYTNDYRSNATVLHGYTGFALNVGRPLRTTFYSTELMQPSTNLSFNAYFAAKDEILGDQPGDLFIAGLYYPRGTYYCVGRAGCGGSTVADSSLEIINRALPRFPGGSGTPSGTFFNSAGGYRYYLPSNHNPNLTTHNWVPCEQLTNICGNGQDVNAGFVYGNDSNVNGELDAYRMKIPNLPGGCEVHIQIAEVDAGYNVKATEFREYIQEKVPGNKLCRNVDIGNGLFNAMDPMGNRDFIVAPTGNTGTWFFACTGTAEALAAEAATAPSCQSNPTGDCCINYPFYPEYKPYHDPP